MSSSLITIIDYGMGNLLSVRRGFEFCGADVEITSDPQKILMAKKVVLPGVGAFADAMIQLENVGLVNVVKEVANKGIPFLGICLGMQLLLDESEEFGPVKGLGLIKGKVVAIPQKSTDGLNLKIPHVGWNEIKPSQQKREWTSFLMGKIKPNDSVYFVHSFMAMPENANHLTAICEYGGHDITAVIEDKNIFGCQFHPEKSGEVGLQILRRFIEL